jgi:riboflavin kinase/FMN adenylyltransferase
VYAESTVPLLEVHLLGDSPSLPASGDRLRFVFDSFLRPEQKFASLEQLQEQIAMDCQQARTLLAKLKEPTSDETGGA